MRRILALLLALLIPSTSFAAGTVVYQGGTGTVEELFNRAIANTAPSFSLTDTTASAKSLTIAVDANLVQLRESAGAANSLLVLDLANNRVGIGTGALALTRTFTIGGENASMRLLSNNASSPQFVLGNAAGTEHWSLYETLGVYGEQGILALHDWVAGTTHLTLSTAGFLGLGLGYVAATSFRLQVAGNIGPNANGVSDLGNTTLGFKRLYMDYTNTGTIGAVTINKASFRANIALGATSVVVTNSLVTAASKVLCVAAQNDTTGRVTATVPGAGTVTIHSIATTADMAIDCLVVNAD